MAKYFQYRGPAEPIPPSAFAPPGDLAWAVLVAQPLPPVRKPVTVQELPQPHEPSEFQPPGSFAWAPPIDQPYPARRRVNQHPTPMVIDSSVFPVPGDGSWLPPIGQPYPAKRVGQVPFDYVGSLEPIAAEAVPDGVATLAIPSHRFQRQFVRALYEPMGAGWLPEATVGIVHPVISSKGVHGVLFGGQVIQGGTQG